jgi:hypothetical protein
MTTCWCMIKQGSNPTDTDPYCCAWSDIKSDGTVSNNEMKFMNISLTVITQCDTSGHVAGSSRRRRRWR